MYILRTLLHVKEAFFLQRNLLYTTALLNEFSHHLIEKQDAMILNTANMLTVNIYSKMAQWRYACG